MTELLTRFRNLLFNQQDDTIEVVLSNRGLPEEKKEELSHYFTELASTAERITALEREHEGIIDLLKSSHQEKLGKINTEITELAQLSEDIVEGIRTTIDTNISTAKYDKAVDTRDDIMAEIEKNKIALKKIFDPQEAQRLAEIKKKVSRCIRSQYGEYLAVKTSLEGWGNIREAVRGHVYTQQLELKKYREKQQPCITTWLEKLNEYLKKKYKLKTAAIPRETIDDIFKIEDGYREVVTGWVPATKGKKDCEQTIKKIRDILKIIYKNYNSSPLLIDQEISALIDSTTHSYQKTFSSSKFAKLKPEEEENEADLHREMMAKEYGKLNHPAEVRERHEEAGANYAQAMNLRNTRAPQSTYDTNSFIEWVNQNNEDTEDTKEEQAETGTSYAEYDTETKEEPVDTVLTDETLELIREATLDNITLEDLEELRSTGRLQIRPSLAQAILENNETDAYDHIKLTRKSVIIRRTGGPTGGVGRTITDTPSYKEQQAIQDLIDSGATTEVSKKICKLKDYTFLNHHRETQEIVPTFIEFHQQQERISKKIERKKLSLESRTATINSTHQREVDRLTTEKDNQIDELKRKMTDLKEKILSTINEYSREKKTQFSYKAGRKVGLRKAAKLKSDLQGNTTTTQILQTLIKYFEDKQALKDTSCAWKILLVITTCGLENDGQQKVQLNQLKEKWQPAWDFFGQRSNARGAVEKQVVGGLEKARSAVAA